MTSGAVVALRGIHTHAAPGERARTAAKLDAEMGDRTRATRAAQALEDRLGDPHDDERVMSFRDAVELDEREEYPAKAFELLHDIGFSTNYVPANLGGGLRDLDELGALVRVLSRRDLTVAIAHGKTFLGALPISIAGDEKQQRGVAHIILAGQRLSLALTEREHGSDLVSSETAARARVDGGFVLDGEKWLISNADRAAAVTVLAKTDERGGPRGSTLFLVERRTSLGMNALPKIRTHGIRGAAIGGLRFDACAVPDDAVVGGAGGLGKGLELTLKSLQVSRTLIPGYSLGAADTGLRLVLDFAKQRRLGGRLVSDMAHARGVLTGAFADILLCEALFIGATRSLHLAPGQASVWSAIAKYFIPVTIERALGELAVVLGARHYLREEHWHGVFQKILRDNAILSVFDGSTVVNCHTLSQQLARLADLRARGADRGLCLALFDVTRALPALDLSKLSLLSRADDVLCDLASVEQELASADVEPQRREELAALFARVRTALHDDVTQVRNAKPDDLIGLAERHAALFAAVCATRFWLVHRAHLTDGNGDADDADRAFAGGAWLAVALDRLLFRLHLAPGPLTAAQGASPLARDAGEAAWRHLRALDDASRLFSAMPLTLARASPAEARP